MAAAIAEDVQDPRPAQVIVFWLRIGLGFERLVELKLMNQHANARQSAKIDFGRRSPAGMDVEYFEEHAQHPAKAAEGDAVFDEYQVDLQGSQDRPKMMPHGARQQAMIGGTDRSRQQGLIAEILAPAIARRCA